MIYFKVKTEDTILFMSRVFVLQATSEAHAIAQVKEKYPNSRVIDVKETECQLEEF